MKANALGTHNSHHEALKATSHRHGHASFLSTYSVLGEGRESTGFCPHNTSREDIPEQAFRTIRSKEFET